MPQRNKYIYTLFILFSVLSFGLIFSQPGANVNVDKLVSSQEEYAIGVKSENTNDDNFIKINNEFGIAIIALLSLIVFFLLRTSNSRLKANRILIKENKELIVAKEKAKQASQIKTNLLSTVSHELRTSLYAVEGLTNILLDEEPVSRQIPHLKSLKISVDYLLNFINDILQINKIEANKVGVDLVKFNLKTKIENVIAVLHNLAKENSIKIHFNYQNGLPETFIGDQLKISQILINLLGNAIKFTKDGDIWVRVKSVEVENKNYTVHFEIEDNGIGIYKEKQEQMFESFSQGSIQVNTQYEGTGLGLSIVKGLVKILNGKVWFKSQLGQGTTFFLEIPLTHVVPQKETVRAKRKKLKDIKTLDLDAIKILIVEDNKINLMITKRILNKMGLNCDDVDNGEDAVDMVIENDYDVVLMDINMSGISGFEATKRIRKFDKALTIFALTAVTLDDKIQEFNEAGFNDVISKPFKQEAFEEKLYDALASKENALEVNL